MLIAADTLRDLGFLLYGGPMVAFTVLVALARRLPGNTPWCIVRAYRAWGPGLGISLGLCILGLLAGHWWRVGSFTWAWSTTSEQWALAAWLTFLAMWISNIKLEIWTLEPLRKLDRDGRITDEAAYLRALGPLPRHMVVHSVMVLAVVVLAVVAQQL